ncbi:MAG TPA: DUF6164 family protein, partial [Burkholderiales bacterium]|nr:DUF6164 family protein [Burkholderiales bacterium]
HLLNTHGIEYSETPPSLISFGSVWVRDEDFQRAKELLAQESAAFAARARDAWGREWRELHRASYARWLVARLRTQPGEMLLALLLLAFFVGLLVVYPLAYLLQRIG